MNVFCRREAGNSIPARISNLVAGPTDTMKTLSLCLPISLASILQIGAAANVIMLDLGSSIDPLGSGAVGPGHADGTIPSGVTLWSRINPTTTPSGVVWGQDTAPNSGTVAWGVASLGDIAFSPPPGSVFDNDVLGDSIRTTSNDFAFGLKIEVPEGRYAIYVTAGSDVFRSQTLQIYSGAVLAGTATSSYAGMQSVVLNNTSFTAFVAGQNFARFEYSVGSGQSIAVISDSTTLGGEAVLSSIQVVPVDVPTVPEGSTWASGLGLIGLASMAWWRRRFTR